MLSLNQIAEDFKKELDIIPDSEKKVFQIIEFTNKYFDTISHRTFPFLEEGIRISKKLNYPAGELLCSANKLFTRFISNELAGTSDEMNRIDSLLPSIKDKVLEYTYIVNLLGYFHWFRGEFDKAFDRVFHALKLIDKIVENKESGWIYFSLGIFYFDTKDYSNSELNFNKTLLIFKKFDVDYGIARTNTAIASIKIRQNKNQEAIPLLEKAILTFRNGNFYAGLGRALNDLALIEKSNSNYERTIELFNESLAIRTKIEHVQGLITTYTELGEIYLMQKDYKNAFLNLEQGLNYSNSVGAKHKSIRIHKLYSDAYKQTDNIQLAFNHFEKFHDLKSDVLSEESALSISKMQTKFETEKSEKEAEIERIKNVELKIANELISEKQKEILDSIHYAKRIQISLLPTEKYIEKTLNRLKK